MHSQTGRETTTPAHGARRRWALLLGLLLFAVTGAYAQPTVPVNQEAELVFDQALEAFEAGDYSMAYRRFRLVYDDFEPNRKTTAALLMAGKALYRTGDYERSAAVLERLIDRYPTSSYVEEANTTRNYALQSLERASAEDQVLDLGILLPLDEGGPATQALFNGIRLAVEEHNEAGGRNRPVRMRFYDTQRDPGRAAAGVAELAEEGAEVIIGPLFSDEALTAARAAEREQIVLMAPLATDEEVSEGRTYAFQANPTITMRGRLMARLAVNGLRLDELGIIAQQDGSDLSERMAEGFMDEALRLGAEVPYYEVLPETRDWGLLEEYVSPDTLAFAEAVYMPISSTNATEVAGRALNSLDRMNAGIRVLGNSRWHDLPMTAQASTYTTTYANDVYINEASPAVQDFAQRYEDLAGTAPDRLAYTGYDVTRYLLSMMTDQPDRPLEQVLHVTPLYQGLATRIDFREGNVNSAMFYFRYRDARLDLLR